jgi:membrane-associated phospholipid phosphatase
MDQGRTKAGVRGGDPADPPKHSLLRLGAAVLAAFVVVEALILGLGVLITRVLDDSGLHQAEAEFENAVLDARDPTLNDVTTVGSWAGATVPIIALGLIACLVLWRLAPGPRFAVFLAVAVVGETALFLVAAAVIDRNRPDIPQLDEAPPTSSFPSGHTAASVALTFGLVIALYVLYRRRRVLVVGALLATLYAGFVLVSRLYRGMHWPTDVATSVLFASVWLLSLRVILLPRSVPARGTTGTAASAPEAPSLTR